MTELVCCVCKRAELGGALDPAGGHDLRPYGPDGQPICFSCSQSTDELRATASALFHAHVDQIRAGGGIPTITKDGLVELDSWLSRPESYRKGSVNAAYLAEDGPSVIGGGVPPLPVGPVAEMWQTYQAECIPGDETVTRRRELQGAFYSGVQGMMCLLASDRLLTQTPDGVAVLTKTITAELLDFVRLAETWEEEGRKGE